MKRPNLSKINAAKRIVLISLALALLLSLFVFADTKNSAQILGDSNRGDSVGTSSLGSSGSSDSPYVSPNPPPSFQNGDSDASLLLPLLYQFHQKDDSQLILALFGDVGDITMTSPSGLKTETSLGPVVSLGDSGENGKLTMLNSLMDRVSLGDSNAVSPTDLPFRSYLRSLPLGLSGTEDSTDSVVEIKDKDFLKLAMQVPFQLTDNGTYFFDLYNSDNEWITQLAYEVTGQQKLKPGEVSITLTTPGLDNERMLFANITDRTNYELRYQPLKTPKEHTIHIYMPPGFTLNGNPADVQNASVTVDSLTPAEYDIATLYDEVEDGELLADWRTTNVPKNYRGYQRISVTVQANTVSEVFFSYNISVHNEEEYKNLSSIMVEYGATPDKTPHATIVQVFDETETLYKQYQHIGYPTLISPVEPIVAPDSLYELGLTYQYSKFNEHQFSPALMLSGVPMFVEFPHYPVTQAYYYIPVIEGQKLTQKQQETLVTINGKQYIKEAVNSRTKEMLLSVRDEKNNGSLMYPEFRKTGTVHSWEIAPDRLSIVPNQSIEIGEMLLSYIYKGETHGPISVKDFGTAVTHNYGKPPSATTTFSLPGMEQWHGDTPRPMGRKDLIQVETNFSSDILKTSNIQGELGEQAIVPVFENASLHFQAPKETTIQEISFVVNGIYSMPGPSMPQSICAVDLVGTEYSLDLESIEQVDSSRYKITVPQELTDIHTLVLTYDKYCPDETGIYRLEVTHGVTNTAPHFTEFTTYLTTKNNTYWEAYNLEDGSLHRKEVPIPDGKYILERKSYSLIEPPKDPLRFGTHGRIVVFAKYDDSTTVIATDRHGTTRGKEFSYEMSGPKPWAMNFAIEYSDDFFYENINIDIVPFSENADKIMSKITGLQFNHAIAYHGAPERIQDGIIYYKSNLSGEEYREIPININNDSQRFISFDLAKGEYVTDLRIAFDLLTKNFQDYAFSSDLNQGEFVFNSGVTQNYGMQISPVFEDSSYYFKGSSQQERVQEGDSFQLQGQLTMDTTGYHINDPSNPDANNTSTATIIIQTYDELEAGYSLWAPRYSGYRMTSEWGNATTDTNGSARTLYTTQSATLRIKDLYNIKTNGHYFSAPKTNETNPTLGHYFDNTPRDLYVQVNNNFDILSLDGYELLSKKKLAGRESDLYHFVGYTNDENEDLLFTLYVKPNAALKQQDIIEGIGVSFDRFYDTYVTADSHFSPPNAKIDFHTNNFPAHWNVSHNITMYNSFVAQAPALIERLNSISMSVQPMLAGGVVQSPVAFRENQKSSLGLRLWLNNGPTPLAKYTSLVHLPRKGVTGPGGNKSEYDVYLEGPLQPESSIPTSHYDITYYANGTEKSLAQLTSSDSWHTVDKISIAANSMPGGASYSFEMSLATPHVKRGTETQDIYSYLSTGYYTTDESQATVNYKDIVFTYESLDFFFRTGYDSLETGQLTLDAVSPAKAVVYSKDSKTGIEEVIYRSTDLEHGNPQEHAVKVNSDVSRVTVEPLDPDAHLLTMPKYGDVPEASNSDFPRPAEGQTVSSLPVDINDITNNILHKYDAAFIRTPTITLPFLYIDHQKNDVVKELPEISFSPLESGGLPSLTDYKKEYLTSDINVISFGKGIIPFYDDMATKPRMERKKMDYYVTIYNSFGDAFKATGQMRVGLRIPMTAEKVVPELTIDYEDPDLDWSTLPLFYIEIHSGETGSRGEFPPNIIATSLTSVLGHPVTIQEREHEDFFLETIRIVNDEGELIGPQPTPTDPNDIYQPWTFTPSIEHEKGNIEIVNHPWDQGTCIINKVPELDFGEVPYLSEDTALRTAKADFSIVDTRLRPGSWTLSVSASSMYYKEGDTVTTKKLPYTALEFSSSSSSTPILLEENVAVEVYSADSVTDGTLAPYEDTEGYYVDWSWEKESELGIIFQPEHNVHVNIGEYVSQLNWMLEMTP